MQKLWCNHRPVYGVVHPNYYPVATAPGSVLVDPLRFVESQASYTWSFTAPGLDLSTHSGVPIYSFSNLSFYCGFPQPLRPYQTLSLYVITWPPTD